MKTKKIIFTMVALVFVFIKMNTIEAQSIVSSEIFTEGTYDGSDISDNGNYVCVTVINVGPTNDEGISRLLEKQTNGTYTILKSFTLTKGTGSSDAVQGVASVIADNGVTYVNYMYGWSVDDGLLRLQKNLPDGTSINVLEYVNDGIATMKVIGGDLYCVFGVGANFDPGTLGNLPSDLAGGYHLMKISGSTDQYVWSNSLGSQFVWNADVEIMQKPGDVDNLYVTYANGDFVKFNRTSGDSLGLVKSGLDGDKYKFDDGGNLHRLITSEHKLIIYDVNDNYASILWQTDWSQANLWNYVLQDWKVIGDKLLGTSENNALHLSNTLIHGYIDSQNSYIDSYGIGYNAWINYDGTFGYIMIDGSIINVLTVTEATEDESLIPTLSNSEADVIAVVDGQTYDGTNWNSAYHQGTLVFADGTLPSVGDTPNSNWIDASIGTHLIILFPVEVDSRSGDLMFRGVFRKDGTAADDINIKITLKEESDVTLENYVVSITKISDGAEPSTNTQFEISLNQSNNSGSAISGNITYSGTATEDVDYTGISSFAIPDGSSSTIIELVTIDDTEVEGTESIIATISGLSTGSLGTAQASADLYDDGDVGIKDLTKNQILVYPNPASEVINISLTKLGYDFKSCPNDYKKLIICDVSGKVVSETEVLALSEDFGGQVNVSKLKPGVYFIKIFNDFGVHVREFVKE